MRQCTRATNFSHCAKRIRSSSEKRRSGRRKQREGRKTCRRVEVVRKSSSVYRVCLLTTRSYRQTTEYCAPRTTSRCCKRKMVPPCAGEGRARSSHARGGPFLRPPMAWVLSHYPLFTHCLFAITRINTIKDLVITIKTVRTHRLDNKTIPPSIPFQ